MRYLILANRYGSANRMPDTERRVTECGQLRDR